MYVLLPQPRAYSHRVNKITTKTLGRRGDVIGEGVHTAHSWAAAAAASVWLNWAIG